MQAGEDVSICVVWMRLTVRRAVAIGKKGWFGFGGEQVVSYVEAEKMKREKEKRDSRQ